MKVNFLTLGFIQKKEPTKYLNVMKSKVVSYCKTLNFVLLINVQILKVFATYHLNIKSCTIVIADKE